MKTLIAVILFCGIVLTPSPADAGQRTKIAFVGDSITYGSLLDDPETQRYPAVAQRILGKRARVTVYAQPGITATATNLEPVFAKRPDVLVLNLGVNDLNQSHPLAEVQASLSQLAAQAKAHRVKVYVMTITPLYGEGFGLNPWIRSTFRTIDAATVMGPEHLLPDNCHPNAAGAQAMGELVARKLR